MWQMVINLFFRNFEIPGQLDGGHFHDIEKRDDLLTNGFHN